MNIGETGLRGKGAGSLEELGTAVVRVRGVDGRSVGTGFLLAPGTVVTCAHVVADALRTDARAATPPVPSVTVEFPLLPGAVTYEAKVSGWRPVATDGTGDIALLRLPEGAPGGAVPLAGAGDVWHHRFRVLGFPATAEHGAWIGGRLLDIVGQGWIAMETDGTGHRIGPGCSGAPVWDEEAGAVIGMTVATDRGASATTSYLIPAAALLDLQPGRRRCPYRGLDAFREKDAEYFFGREDETRRLLDAVERHLVVPVVGPSGSGKTSLVRAGVLPRLRAEGFTVSEIRPLPGTRASLTVARAVVGVLGASGAAWAAGALGASGAAVAQGPSPEAGSGGAASGSPATGPDAGPVMSPGPDPGPRPGPDPAAVPAPRPEAALNPALAAVEQERAALALADLLDSADGPTAAELGRRVLDHCGPRGHVFFLNQLEETVAAETATARALLALVVDLVSAPAEGRRLRVLATLRSSCLDDLADPVTARVLSDCAQVVAPLGRSALLRAIEGPAARVPGLTLDTGLAVRIVDDAEDEPGHLPLMEFALTELWSHEKGVRLTHSGYEALGGVAGALSAHAEQRVGDVIAVHGEAPVRRLFTQLARPDDAGGFTRKPVRLAPLPPDLREVAEALATRTRFVRITHGPDDDPIVDLAHEELVRAWGRLETWLTASRDFRAWQERLLQAMGHWRETGGEPGALLRGTMLATSLERLADPDHREEITQPERDYMESSRRHQQRALRRWRLATAVVVVLALLAGYLAVQMWRGERALEERVRTMVSRRLVEDALRLAATEPGMAARLSLAAWHTHPGKEARQALLQAYLGGMSVISVHKGQGAEPIGSIDMTPDGSTVVTTSVGRDGAAHAQVWTGLGDGRASSWRVPGLTGGGAPKHAEFSDDGALLAIVTADGTVHCYDVRTHKHLWAGPRPALGTQHMPDTVALDFSDSGRLVLRVVADRAADSGTARSSHVQVWQSRTGTEEKASQKGLPSGSRVTDAALVAEGRDVVFLSGYEDKREARVQNLVTGGNPRPVADAAWLSHRGAGVLVDRGHGWHKPIRLTGSRRAAGRRILAVGAEGPDLTGRYVVERATTRTSQFEVVDIGTGKRYRVPGVPSSGAREELMPVGVLPGEEGGTAPRILVAAGADLLVVRTQEQRSMPLPALGPYSVEDGDTYMRSPGGEYRAQAKDHYVTVGKTVRLMVARRGEEHRAEVVTAEEFEEGLSDGFFTTDGSNLVLRDADEVSVREPGSPRKVRVRSFPDLVDVAPLRGSEVVVQTSERLIRYDVASDEDTVLGDYPCDALRDPCTGIAVRPGKRDEVAIGHGGGEVAVWDIDTGRVRGNTGITVAAAYGMILVFGPRGRTLATKLDVGTIQRWDMETGERVGPAVVADERVWAAALADDGTLLTGDGANSGLVLWRPGDGDEPYVTLPFTAAPEDLHLTADRLVVHQANSRLTIPLDPESWRRALCRHWAPYSPQERLFLDHAGAAADSPCA
ncbi:trypsin-like peptidase domain-containing protein [Streptomyces sp. NPDC057623]|uniref:nSTAND1 domain-containing NTPase n=1 Tax=Streptomyces sp. NPDC057623 TaxID=3346187 RepID=UPI00367759D3